MCSVCNFCGSPSFLGKMNKYINRSVVCEGDSIPSLYFFWEKNPEPWPVFVRPLANEGLFFYNDHGILYVWKYITAVVTEGAKVVDICTTILPHLASDGSPLFAQPMFPYHTISFSWNKRLLESKFLCDECSVNFCNFFCEGNNTVAGDDPNKQTRNETSRGVSQQVRLGTILRVGKTRKPRKTKGDG